MDFSKLVLKRQSDRAYRENVAVDRALITQCIEAARLAPSACNSQPWRFVVVDEPNLRKQVAETTCSGVAAAFNRFALQAPVLVVVVMEKPSILSQIGGRVKDKDFYLMDIGIAAEHFCLQAAELGLGTCLLGWFNEKKLASLIGLPKGKRIGLVITLGYPTTELQREKKRKSLEQVVSYNSY
jgi:nitroreductase